jgi:predicted phage-related endonuclease
MTAAARLDVYGMGYDEFRRWLNEAPDRRGYTRSIGGSQVGAILGINQYKTAADVYDELLDLKPPMQPDADLERGILMEPVIAELYVRHTGRFVTRGTADSVKYLMHNDAWFHALLDGRIQPFAHPKFDGPGGLEIKCHNEWVFNAMLAGGVDPSYYAQLQLYLHIHGYKWGAFALFCPEKWQLEQFDVEYDQEFVEQVMLPRASEFWNNHVLARIRPEVTVPVELPAQAIRLGATELNRTDERWMALMAQAKREKEAFDIAKHAFEATKDLIRAEIEAGEHEIVTSPLGKVSYKEHTTRTVKRELLEAAGIDPTPFLQVTASRTLLLNFGRGR